MTTREIRELIEKQRFIMPKEDKQKYDILKLKHYSDQELNEIKTVVDDELRRRMFNRCEF